MPVIAWALNVWNWVRAHPWAQWAIGVGLFLVGWNVWLRERDATILRTERKTQEAKRRVEHAEATVELMETAREIQKENQTHATEAREAVASLPEYGSADELRDKRPDLAVIVFGDRARSGDR